MADNEVIIPDSQDSLNFKLNFKNLFTFLSSLDYIRALEFSQAMKYMDTKQLYFVGEKQGLILFAYTHTSFWIFISYIAILLTAKAVFEIPPQFGILFVGLLWMLFGFWFVNKYTWGNGYLWSVTKDFMINMTLASIVVSIAIDIVILYIIPFVYNWLVEWMTSGSKEGDLNYLAQTAAEWVVMLVKPFVSSLTQTLSEFLPVYLTTSTLKTFSFLVPTAYMFYIHRERKDYQKRLNNLLKKIS